MRFSLRERQSLERSRKTQEEGILAKAKEASSRIRQILDYPQSTDKEQWVDSRENILEISQGALPGFAVLDGALISSILRVYYNIEDYKNDPTRRRPYNVLMFARPGSGKSHLIKCIANHLKIPAVTGNLSNPHTIDTMSFVINEARNHKALDSLPILFLDEIDSNPSQMPLFLPLLWDGEFSAKGQCLNVGRCIIVCAISNPILTEYLKTGKDEHILKQKFPIFCLDLMGEFSRLIL